jgi:hypothetical protein
MHHPIFGNFAKARLLNMALCKCHVSCSDRRSVAFYSFPSGGISNLVVCSALRPVTMFESTAHLMAESSGCVAVLARKKSLASTSATSRGHALPRPWSSLTASLLSLTTWTCQSRPWTLSLGNTRSRRQDLSPPAHHPNMTSPTRPCRLAQSHTAF